MRDNTVFMKTLGGLQRVDVILRRVDDNFCDPLELLPDSYLGVPGLLQAVRCGNVAVANAIGCGVLQAPGFLPFLPAVCRYLLGEELKLPSVETWWCGQPEILDFVVQRLPEMVVKSAYPTLGEDPVFGPSLTREQLTALEKKIRAHPARYVAQRQAMACTTPALVGEEIEPRRFVVRSYLSAYGDSYTVMNGGLSRITQSNDTLVVFSATRRPQQRHLDFVRRSRKPRDACCPRPRSPSPSAAAAATCPAGWRRTCTGWGAIRNAPTVRRVWRAARSHGWLTRQALTARMPCRFWPQLAAASPIA